MGQLREAQRSGSAIARWVALSAVGRQSAAGARREASVDSTAPGGFGQRSVGLAGRLGEGVQGVDFGLMSLGVLVGLAAVAATLESIAWCLGFMGLLVFVALLIVINFIAYRLGDAVFARKVHRHASPH